VFLWRSDGDVSFTKMIRDDTTLVVFVFSDRDWRLEYTVRVGKDVTRRRRCSRCGRSVLFSSIFFVSVVFQHRG